MGAAAPRRPCTDADLLLGRIDPAGFSGGRMALDRGAAEEAIRQEVAEPLGLALELAALGVSEIVDENMANAARVHAIESGKDARGRTLVAFGGAAPLHAARMAEKLGLDHVLVPSYAGVGSAVGFLRAPIAYEIVRSSLQRLDKFDAGAANALFAAMRAEAEPIIRRGAGDAPLTETRSAFMRYRGQGHEIAVSLPTRSYRDDDAAPLRDAFENEYRRLYSRVIPGVEVEILSWVLLLSAPIPTRNGDCDWHRHAIHPSPRASSPFSIPRPANSSTSQFTSAATSIPATLFPVPPLSPKTRPRQSSAAPSTPASTPSVTLSSSAGEPSSTDSPGNREASFTPEIAIDASFLPGELHGDPADRLIVASARHLGVPIVTLDRRIIAYGRDGHLQVIPC